MEGELGDGTFTDRNVPVPVSGGLTFAALTAGSLHTCGLTPGGVAYCWGSDFGGQLGDGANSDKSVPTEVAGGLTFSMIRADSWNMTCGRVIPSGTLHCWGAAYGFGVYDDVASGVELETVATGSNHECGLTATGAAYCWGDNAWGALGDGTVEDRATPVAVTGGLTFAQIGAGVEFTCGLTTAGTAYCWGWGAPGYLGDGTWTAVQTIPVAAHVGVRFRSLSVGQIDTCGLTLSQVYCWGANAMGEVGDGTRTPRNAPTLVATTETFTTVAVGGNHTCGTTDAGAVLCWGLGFSGQLGYGGWGDFYSPVAVTAPSS